MTVEGVPHSRIDILDRRLSPQRRAQTSPREDGLLPSPQDEGDGAPAAYTLATPPTWPRIFPGL